jgi:HAD superfamily hydrolase (TIGR01549 family)
MVNPELQTSIHLSNYKLLIFDLDGTLYDQRCLRFKMLIALIIRLLTFRINIIDIRIISTFRKQRERHKGYSSLTLETDQLDWCSAKLGLPVSKIQHTIEELMYKLPLKYLKSTLYKGVHDFISILKDKGYSIAIYSDYPVDDKLEALGLIADKTFCSTDRNIGSLKPNNAALLTICQFFNCSTEDAIFFGDRDDTDGESARMADIKFVKIDISKARTGKYYELLTKQI